MTYNKETLINAFPVEQIVWGIKRSSKEITSGRLISFTLEWYNDGKAYHLDFKIVHENEDGEPIACSYIRGELYSTELEARVALAELLAVAVQENDGRMDDLNDLPY